jgi:hypothetical protein
VIGPGITRIELKICGPTEVAPDMFRTCEAPKYEFLSKSLDFWHWVLTAGYSLRDTVEFEFDHSDDRWSCQVMDPRCRRQRHY